MTDTFINSCVNIFMAQPLLYSSVESRVRFALSFMKGDALRWRDAFFKDIGTGVYVFTTWEDFTDRLQASFGNPFRVDEAQRKLHTIEQGQRSAEVFFIEFEDLKAESGFCDASIIFELKRALRKDVREEANRRVPKSDSTTTYQYWKNVIIKVDQDLRGSAADQSFFSNNIAPVRRFTPGFTFNRSKSNIPDSSSTTPAPASSDRGRSSSSTPFTSTTRNPALKTAPTTSTARSKACYGCGSLEHLWRDCKKAKIGDKARVLLEQVDEVDASVDVMRKMMEDANTLDEEIDADVEIFARVAADYPEFFVHSDE